MPSTFCGKNMEFRNEKAFDTYQRSDLDFNTLRTGDGDLRF